MKKPGFSRREFVRQNTIAGAGTVLSMGLSPSVFAAGSGDAGKPAILGGKPVHTGDWPDWPVWDLEKDEPGIVDVLRSGNWSRADVVSEFEEKWAKTIGTKRCLATTNGTHALIVALSQLGVGAGDEVIVGPYTFIATIDAILLNGAMPVFVDTNPATFQIDADKIPEKITSRTAALLPVHILGLPADMGRIMEIAGEKNLPVLEDACQAWLAEIGRKKAGSIGNAGCFSFQNSKHLPIGEGGAIVSDDEEFMDRCFSFHNFGRPHGKMVGDVSGGYVMLGTKCRMTEYQAAIGLAQLERLEGQTRVREENAAYLREMITDIPGILPYELNKGVTRANFHMFPFRYRKEHFHDLPHSGFIDALKAEGIPCSGGYTPLNKMAYLRDTFQSKLFQKVYPKKMLDFDAFIERNQCPENDRLCEEAIWIYQSRLLGTRKDMEDIAAAIEKVHDYSEEIAASM